MSYSGIQKISRYPVAILFRINLLFYLMSYSPLSSKSGFTLVELIVGMTIFSVGMTAILALLHSTIDTSIASRQEIIASNLLREQIELIKNVRNSNVRSFVPWDTSFTG
jgi:prepilin-type N-terminal cleavage/methylation domain-containing protein